MNGDGAAMGRPPIVIISRVIEFVQPGAPKSQLAGVQLHMHVDRHHNHEEFERDSWAAKLEVELNAALEKYSTLKLDHRAVMASVEEKLKNKQDMLDEAVAHTLELDERSVALKARHREELGKLGVANRRMADDIALLESPVKCHQASQEHVGEHTANTEALKEHVGEHTADTEALLKEHVGEHTADTEALLKEHVGERTANTEAPKEHVGEHTADTEALLKEHVGEHTADTEAPKEHVGEHTADTEAPLKEHVGEHTAGIEAPKEHVGEHTAGTEAPKGHVGEHTAGGVALLKKHVGERTAGTEALLEVHGSPHSSGTEAPREHMGKRIASIEALLSVHESAPSLSEEGSADEDDTSDMCESDSDREENPYLTPEALHASMQEALHRARLAAARR